MVRRARQGDYFDRARLYAAAALVVAGLVTIAGSLLDWVSVEEEARLVPGFDFGGQEVERPVFVPFQGIDHRDGVVTLGAGVALCLFAVALVVRRRSGWGWLAFLTSMVIGAIGIADYKGANDLSSGLCRRMECQGDVAPGIGITLVAAAAVLGLLASVAAIAATPQRDDATAAGG